MSVKREDFDSLFDIPNLGGVVLSSRDDSLAVGAEVDRHDVTFMTLHRAPQRPVVGRIQVQSVVVSGGSEPAAIRAEGHADDRLLGTDQ